MSETLVVMEMVEGRFGPLVKDVAGNVFNFSKKYSGFKSFDPGTKLEADVFVSQKGKFTNRYINSAKVVGQDVVASTAILPATQKKSPAKPFKSKDDTSMSKAEWDRKDTRISRQGCIQAAINALGPVLSTDVLFDEAVKLADKMLGYVNKV